jgi:hypothetical protein
LESRLSRDSKSVFFNEADCSSNIGTEIKLALALKRQVTLGLLVKLYGD